jgi:hypothetical protein
LTFIQIGSGHTVYSPLIQIKEFPNKIKEFPNKIKEFSSNRNIKIKEFSNQNKIK